MWHNLVRKWFPSLKFPYCIKNIKNIPKFIGEIIFIFKNGYPYEAMYNHDMWFIDTEQKILRDFIKYGSSYPSEFAPTFETPEDYVDDIGKIRWDSVLGDMINYLEYMKEDGIYYPTDEEILKMSTEDTQQAWKDRAEKMESAKDEFFKLYTKYFWSLWD